MRQALDRLKNQSGSALLMALFTVTILMVIATEVMYQTSVEAKVSAQALNQLKAYYAAKSGVELGLFRVHLYRKTLATLGDLASGDKGGPDLKSMLDMIWNFPFAWPFPVPDAVGAVEKDQIGKSVKESLMQAQYTLNIESEGSKIDINDLASPSKVVAAATREQVMQIFNSKLQNDEEFGNKYRSFDFNQLVNNLTDWIDENTESLNGGDEGSVYPDIRSDTIPPNQAFKTLGELHMVATMNDELFDLLAPRITVYGTKGINVNYATKDVLQSLTPLITSEIADKIITGRTDPQRGPYKDLKDFVGHLNTLGVAGNPFVDGDTEKIPLVFGAEFNFRIKAAGKAGAVIKEITAITFDYEQVKERLGELLKKQAEKEKPTPTPTPGVGGNDPNDKNGNGIPDSQENPDGTKKADEKAKTKIPKERPTVVYWVEG